MMPTDENLYGQWPKCGEIDIMEVLGQETNKAYGTSQYVEPHDQSLSLIHIQMCIRDRSTVMRPIPFLMQISSSSSCQCSGTRGKDVYKRQNQYNALKMDEDSSVNARDRRFDVTLMINGLPMIHIEQIGRAHV